MSRKERDVSAFQLTQNKAVRRLTEWCRHAFFPHICEPRHGVQTTASDDANLCLLQTFLLL
jgi:hypothetical protein